VGTAKQGKAQNIGKANIMAYAVVETRKYSEKSKAHENLLAAGNTAENIQKCIPYAYWKDTKLQANMDRAIQEIGSINAEAIQSMEEGEDKEYFRAVHTASMKMLQGAYFSKQIQSDTSWIRNCKKNGVIIPKSDTASSNDVTIQGKQNDM
tara:strand:- start:321 stop:773 length:453 start_codon:yes stop_codon:yes gene_type:complete